MKPHGFLNRASGILWQPFALAPAGYQDMAFSHAFFGKSFSGRVAKGPFALRPEKPKAAVGWLPRPSIGE
jgi:hypothetical protein